MKKKVLLFVAGIALLSGTATAQDSLYIYKGGSVVSKRATAQIDSIVFYNKTITTPPIGTVTTPPIGTITTPPISTVTTPPIGTITTPPIGTVITPPLSTITYASVIDGENNNYKTVVIGKQIWMAENLKVTKYNDGTIIPHITENTAWDGLTTGAFCTYKNTTNADTIKTNGRLYNWYAVNTGKLCPTGWHVPSDAEWTTLSTYLIANGYNYDGSNTGNYFAKSMASTTGWNTNTSTGAIGNNPSTNNKSGFTALPGGNRGGDFAHGIGTNGCWWSSTDDIINFAYYRALLNYSSSLTNLNDLKHVGLSVRCLKN